MKLIRYIRPTSRRSTAWQRSVTERAGIALDVIEGDQGRDWNTALKMLKSGNGLLAAEPETLGRKIETRARRVQEVAAKGAWIILADGGEHSPEAAANLIDWMRAGGDRDKPAEPRVAHNRTPDDVMIEAQRYWTQKQFSRMTNGEVAAAVGLSVPTLTRAFGPRSQYIETRPGRPKKR